MSQPQKLLTIARRLRTVFRTIDGGDDYNFDIHHDNVKIGFVSPQNAPSKPAIYISYVETELSDIGDQVTYNVPVSVEIFAYVDHEIEPVEQTLLLLADMEKVVYADPTLNDNVYGLVLQCEAGALDNMGIGSMRIRAMLEYIRSSS